MRWTRTPPTVPGVYWYRDPRWPAQVGVCQIIEDNGLCVLWCGDQREQPLTCVTGEWAGPIQPPGEEE